MKSKHIFIILVTIYLLGFLSGGFIQHSWDMRSIDKVDSTTVWKQASLDTASAVAITTEAPPSVSPVIISSDRIKPAADPANVQIRPEIVTVTGKLSGGLTYQARLSGIQPQLQDIQVNYPVSTVTSTIRTPYKGWLLSISSSFTSYIAPQFQTLAALSLETSYNIGRLHIGLHGGVADVWSPKAGHHITPCIGGRITVDLFRMK